VKRITTIDNIIDGGYASSFVCYISGLGLDNRVVNGTTRFWSRRFI